MVSVPVRPLPFVLDLLRLEGDWPRGSAEQTLLLAFLNTVTHRAATSHNPHRNSAPAGHPRPTQLPPEATRFSHRPAFGRHQLLCALPASLPLAAEARDEPARQWPVCVSAEFSRAFHMVLRCWTHAAAGVGGRRRHPRRGPQVSLVPFSARHL